MFDNPFPEDMGRVLSWEDDAIEEGYDANAPGITTDAFLPKRWAIAGGERRLLKGAYSGQEPFNEVVASRLMERLGAGHVPYEVTFDRRGRPYSSCPDMVTRDTELVPMYWLIRSGRPKHMSAYDFCVRRCAGVGVDIAPFLDRMLTVDFLMANEDRHYNNFGLLRDARTLACLGPAPVYDTGTSLGCLWDVEYVRTLGARVSKPFKKTHEEQIRLVKNFDWLDFDALEGFEDEIADILSAGAPAVSLNRAGAVIALWRDRVRDLRGRVALRGRG